MTSAVTVQTLGVDLRATGADIVDDFTLTIEEGEIVGLVGESGSGKTTVGLALLNHARRGAQIARGTVSIAGLDVLALEGDELLVQRGKLVSYVPQDPATALNPALRIKTQLREVLEVHDPGLSKAEIGSRLDRVLTDVKLPATDEFLRRFPHQLSGGQQQRVTIAMAFLLRPRAIVLDEPTTGLDVTTQSHVLETVREMCKANGVAAVYITHDLAAVAGIADRIVVMYAGRVAELGVAATLLEAPAHPYTARLIEAVPSISERRLLKAIPGTAPSPGSRPTGCSFAPRCPMAVAQCQTAPPAVEVGVDHASYCWRATEVVKRASEIRADPKVASASAEPLLLVRDLSCSYGPKRVVEAISLEVDRGECLALVGESGSGKTSLVRAIAGLMENREGNVELEGVKLAVHARDRDISERRAVQYVFQNPYASLNPRKTIREIVARPIKVFGHVRGSEVGSAVERALDGVALPSSVLDRYPDQLSGGERQRVAIARALICDPKLLICDEITSALDVSVQAAIIDLLQSLTSDQGLALLFVTHNLALVRSLGGRTAVINQGAIVEEGESDTLLSRPTAAYTKTLLANTPTL